jgi:hypothetical protein
VRRGRRVTSNAKKLPAPACFGSLSVINGNNVAERVEYGIIEQGGYASIVLARLSGSSTN